MQLVTYFLSKNTQDETTLSCFYIKSVLFPKKYKSRHVLLLWLKKNIFLGPLILAMIATPSYINCFKDISRKLWAISGYQNCRLYIHDITADRFTFWIEFQKRVGTILLKTALLKYHWTNEVDQGTTVIFLMLPFSGSSSIGFQRA